MAGEYDLGPPLAHGRTADVFDWKEGTILKLFHSWFDLPSIEYEQRLGRAIHASGLPVPAVHELIQVNDRNGLVYQRVDGIPMVEIFMQKPWRLVQLAHCMAALHAEMHANPLRPDLPLQRSRLEHKISQAAALPEALKDRALSFLATLPDGSSICHGDFHPGNVLMQQDGTVIIDWIDASLGNSLADVARTSILILGAAASTQIPNPLIKTLVRLFHRVYLNHYFRLRPGAQDEYQRWIPVVAAARLSENIPEVQGWLLSLANRIPLERKLGIFESALTVSNEFAPFNVVNILQFQGTLETAILRRALEILQERYAILNVRILAQDGKMVFTPAQGRAIPLEVIARQGDDHWQRVVEAELERRIEIADGPLIRFLYLPPGEGEGRGEIIFTASHTILDAAASQALWKELLRLCQSLSKGDATDAPNQIPLMPPAESLFPERWKGLARSWSLLRYGLASAWDEATYPIRASGVRKPVVIPGGRNQVLTQTFSEPLTTAFASRCRREQATLNSAINAAMLLAVNCRLYAGQATPMRTFTFADLRPYLSPAPPIENLGCYISMLRYTMPVSGKMDFWELARELNQKIYRSFQSGDKFSANLVSRSLMKLLTGVGKIRMGSTALSYAGVVVFENQPGDLQVLDLHGFISAIAISPEYAAQAHLYNDQLTLDIVYQDSDLSTVAAREVAAEIERIIAAAVG